MPPRDPFAEAVEGQGEAVFKSVPPKAPEADEAAVAAEPEAPLAWERPPGYEEEDGALTEIGISIAPAAEESREPELEPDPVLALMASQVAGISRQMNALMGEFQDKIKHDAYRETIIERLHSELQAYKEDVFRKPLQSMVTDMIKVIDDMRRLAAHYRSRELALEDLPKLLQVLTDIPEDMEEIFQWRGINAFKVEGDAFDPGRQRITRKVATGDLALDKTVAERILPGYEWDGKIIRPETVAVYVHQEGFGGEEV